MKKICILTAFMLFAVLFLIGCNDPSASSTADSTAATTPKAVVTTAPTTTVPITTVAVVTTTEAEMKGIPTPVYQYELNCVGGDPASGKVDSMTPIYDPPVSERTEALFIHEKLTSGAPLITTFPFFGENQAVTHAYLYSFIAYPTFPIEFGAFSVYMYRISSEKRGTVYIRHETQKPIFFFGRDDAFFQDLDTSDDAAITAFATDILKQYVDLEGYTLFVYEDTITSSNSEALTVEYNYTIDGQKTNCYATMTISKNKTYYSIQLTDAIKDIIEPYRSFEIDSERVDAIIQKAIQDAYRSPFYRLDSYDIRLEYQVLDNSLKAYVVVTPMMSDYETGEEIFATQLYLLLDVASIEYVE